MESQAFTFAASRLVPIATGFFGLGSLYFIWGRQASWFPKTSPQVNKTLGIWGFWMPGFMLFITGVYPLIDLAWFNVFGDVAPGLLHPLVCHGSSSLHRGERRARWLDGDRVLVPQHSRVDVFRRAGDIPVMIIFVCLALIDAVEIPTRLFSWGPGARLVGLLQFVTGIWLMYCTYAITVDLALCAKVCV
jgi:hypothetical protein